jgi:hypothetical protein
MKKGVEMECPSFLPSLPPIMLEPRFATTIASSCVWWVLSRASERDFQKAQQQRHHHRIVDIARLAALNTYID